MNITRHRTETAILRDNAREIADFCGEQAVLLEYGAGAGIKTEILIDALDRPRLYVPIDIAGDFLDETVVADAAAVPRPADIARGRRFHMLISTSRGGCRRARRSAFFPGSTMGNLDAREAKQIPSPGP